MFENVSALECFWLTLTPAIAFLILAPPISSWLGWTIQDCKTIGSAGDVDFEPDERSQELIEQLLELGYRPLGLRRETAKLFGPHWHWTSDAQRILISPDRKSAAFVYRVVSTLGPYVAFQTRFDNDTLLWTTSNTDTDATPVAGYDCVNVRASSVSEVLSIHEQLVASRQLQDLEPVTIDDMEAVNGNSRLTYQKIKMDGMFRRLGRTCVISYLTIASVVVLLANVSGVRFGSHIISNCVAFVVGLMGMSCTMLMLPWLARRDRDRRQSARALTLIQDHAAD